jgi:hypothetical protein
MSTITDTIKGANPSAKPDDKDKKPAGKPRILSLQHYLELAFSAEQTNLEPTTMVIGGFTLTSKSASISITMLDSAGDPHHHYAGILDKDPQPTNTTPHLTGMDYSGSLVKVAALYAAHDLRAAARQHAKDKGDTFAAFGGPQGFAQSFTTAIDTTNAAADLLKPPLPKKPDLGQIFTGFASTGPNRVEFKPSYKHDLEEILENENAGRVIRPLGYAYINVSLMKGGFYDPATKKGIWLAGDYSGATITPTVRVPVDNDSVPDGSGQAMTTEQMSRMFRLVHLGKAFTHVKDAAEQVAANTDMHALLASQGSFFFGSNATVQISETPAFTKDCAKVGIGKLGPLVNPPPNAPRVISEGSVMHWADATQLSDFNRDFKRTLTGDFVLVWQNVYHPNAHFDALIRVVNTCIEKFLKQV